MRRARDPRQYADVLLGLAVLLGSGCGGDYEPPFRQVTGTAAPLGQVFDLETSLPFLWIDGAEAWSVRKSLRRTVRHELMHWKSIRRIISAYPG